MIKPDHVIGISDYKVSKAPSKLVTYALGSCVGIALYDDLTRVGGLAHIMLPDSSIMLDQKKVDRMKFADTAIPDLIREVRMNGANVARLKAKIVGGANLFQRSGTSSVSNIGDRNVEMVKNLLATQGIELIAEDTGKNFGRTLYFDLATGDVLIKSLDKDMKSI
ncbi:MAG: chemotaxis protein CheD [Clostridiales Family XIII bacterium]|jgi:chemotaxis protein CheD|nr:chemotaxis protein CheD [Clostridiales Family XIII bacterium]